MTSPNLFLLRIAGLCILHAGAALAAPAAPADLASGEVPAAVSAATGKLSVWVRVADGREPEGSGWSTRCPDCGNFHVNSLSEAMKEERPAQAPAFLVAPNRVIAPDPLVHERFIERFEVELGGRRHAARPAAYASDRPAMLLELEERADAAPLAFSTQAPPAHVLQSSCTDGIWRTLLQRHAASGWLIENGLRYRTVPSHSLLLDETGAPVSLVIGERIPAEELASNPEPDQWAWTGIAAYDKARERVRSISNASVLRAQVRLRQRPAAQGERMGMWQHEEADKEAVKPVPALVLAPRRVLVMAVLGAAQTARLESVRLRHPDGRELAATFVGSWQDFTGIVVDPGEDLSPFVLSDEGWTDKRDRLLYAVEVELRGDAPKFHVGHVRASALSQGLKGRIVPDFGKEVEDLLVFDDAGRLAGVPATKRLVSKSNPWDSATTFTLAASELRVLLGDTSAWEASKLRPRPESEERRIVWLGADLQAISAELAEVHGALQQTEDGTTGAVVSHVHPDSPAARAGLKPGDVLVRIQAEGATEPVAIRLEEGMFGSMPFPWENYDQIPEQFFEQIPTPWPDAEDSVNQQLKELGEGTPYRLDYVRDGASASANLVTEMGPPHYGSAAEFVDETIGLRARELTFETRRFFQIKEGEPGLIVSRVTSGLPAGVAGLKPFELIISVNEKPVRTRDELADALKAGGTVRLQVRRMHQNRVATLAAAPVK